MELEEIQDILSRAIHARPPRFNGDRPAPPAVKVSAMEDYLLETAYLGAELEEALFYLDRLVAHFAEEIERMHGWEVALPRKPKDRITQADIAAAKRTVHPESFDAGTEAKQLRASAMRQIDRFRFEAQFVISRGYTMVTGG